MIQLNGMDHATNTAIFSLSKAADYIFFDLLTRILD